MKVKDFIMKMQEEGFEDAEIQAFLSRPTIEDNLFDIDMIKKAKKLTIHTIDNEVVTIDMEIISVIDEKHIEWEQYVQYHQDGETIQMRQVTSIPLRAIVKLEVYYY